MRELPKLVLKVSKIIDYSRLFTWQCMLSVSSYIELLSYCQVLFPVLAVTKCCNDLFFVACHSLRPRHIHKNYEMATTNRKVLLKFFTVKLVALTLKKNDLLFTGRDKSYSGPILKIL